MGIRAASATASTNAWGINISGSGSSLTGTNAGYNGSLAAGQSATFGMQGTASWTISTSGCTVN